jgi:circadian clock protein KaiB
VSATPRFERLVVERDEDRYRLVLYVTGMTPRSTHAVAMVKALCEELLGGKYELGVVDMYQEPGRARDDQIVATPTLVKRSPAPPRRLIGDMSSRKRMLAALGLPESGETR